VHPTRSKGGVCGVDRAWDAGAAWAAFPRWSLGTFKEIGITPFGSVAMDDHCTKKIAKEAFDRLQIEISHGLVCHEFDGEMVVQEKQSGLVFGFNPFGSRIWRMLEKKMPPILMVEKLQEEFAVEPDLCRQQVVTFLDELETNNLILPVSLPPGQ